MAEFALCNMTYVNFYKDAIKILSGLSSEEHKELAMELAELALYGVFNEEEAEEFLEEFHAKVPS